MSQLTSPPMSPRKGKHIACKVYMLDDTTHVFHIPVSRFTIFVPNIQNGECTEMRDVTTKDEDASIALVYDAECPY